MATYTSVHFVETSKLIPHAQAGLIPPATPEEYKDLKADIERNGIKTPLHATTGFVVLAGHTRLAIAKELGLAEVPVMFANDMSDEDQVLYLVNDDLHRRHLTPSQRAAIITHPTVQEALIAEMESKAKARILAGKAAPEEAGAQGRAPQTRDKLGALASVSGKLIQDARYAWNHATDRMEAIIAGTSKDTVTKVAKEVHNRPRQTTLRPRPDIMDSTAKSLQNMFGAMPVEFQEAYERYGLTVLGGYLTTLMKAAEVNLCDEAARERFTKENPKAIEIRRAWRDFAKALGAEVKKLKAEIERLEKENHALRDRVPEAAE